MTEQHFKVINLHAENVKKLKVVDITPDPEANTVIISGKNGQGKTSVLDSILFALAGKDAIQSKPIRDGEDTAEITLDIGKYLIKRTFTQKGTYITVESHDGAKYPTPQKLLDDMMGSITFDPLEFTRMKPKDQYETLKSFVGIDIDTIESRIKTHFDERTEVNRQVKEYQATVKSMEESLNGKDIPDAPIDIVELSREISRAQDQQNQLRQLKTDKQNLVTAISDLETKLAELKARHVEVNDAYNKVLESAPLKATIDALQARLENANDHNALHQKHCDLGALKSKLDTKSKEATQLTDMIDKAKSDKEKAIADANLPLDGLSVGDGIVLFNGIPFDQTSNAEQIKISCAIAMSMQPKLRVLRIKDGSLLDDESLATVNQIAKTHDFQVWIERVQDDSPVAIIIEDGEVKK